jgi:hypothetical protein
MNWVTVKSEKNTWDMHCWVQYSLSGSLERALGQAPIGFTGLNGCHSSL